MMILNNIAVWWRGETRNRYKRVHRKTFQLHCGEIEIELSVDKGEIAAGQKTLPICEVELGLKRGQRGDLFKMAKTLADDVPAQLAIVSKAERGYVLLTGEKPQPVKAVQIALEPEANVQSAFQIIAWACIHQLIANQPVMRSGDPDGLHQMRVALRRLRAAISLFSDVFADTQTDTVKSELKWIAGELGPARELDVFSKRVVKPVQADKPNGAGIAILSRDLRQRRRMPPCELSQRSKARAFVSLFLIRPPGSRLGIGSTIRIFLLAHFGSSRSRTPRRRSCGADGRRFSSGASAWTSLMCSGGIDCGFRVRNCGMLRSFLQRFSSQEIKAAPGKVCGEPRKIAGRSRGSQ
jgi:hypothetical protein